MRIRTLSSIFCKSRQLFGDGTVPFAFLVITTLFLSADWFMDRYILPKNMGFIFGVVLWGGVYLTNRKLKTHLMIDLLSVSLTTFMGCLFVRSLFTPQYIQCVYIGTAWILFVLLRNREASTEVFSLIISVVGVFQALYGLLQYTGYMETQSYFSILGAFDNPAGFAVSISLCYPFLLHQSALGQRRKIKLFACVFLGIVAVLSGSRAGILSLFIVTFLFYMARHKEMIIRWRILFIGGGTLILAGLFIGLIYIKPASASGRMLIWKVSAKLCSEHILWGNGVDSFKADYMSAQANYLSSSQASDAELKLAGDTNHPFNEYLLVLIEMGILGVVLLLFLLFTIFRCKMRFDSPELLALVAIALFSCFSYPFKYAFVWFMSIYCLSSLAKNMLVLRKVDIPSILFFLLFSGALCVVCVFAIRTMVFERKWKQVAPALEEDVGLLDKELSIYAQLDSTWNGNPYFLYNYGAELNRNELYEKSVDIFLRCESYSNTYNLQMQLADNYYHLECWAEAESRYQKALAMCPSRFLPLQGLLRLYVKWGDLLCAEQIALEILDKPVKVPSYTVAIIQEEAKTHLHKNPFINSKNMK